MKDMLIPVKIFYSNLENKGDNHLDLFGVEHMYHTSDHVASTTHIGDLVSMVYATENESIVVIGHVVRKEGAKIYFNEAKSFNTTLGWSELLNETNHRKHWKVMDLVEFIKNL